MAHGPQCEKEWFFLCNGLIKGSIAWSEFTEEVGATQTSQDAVVGTRFRRGQRFGTSEESAMEKVRTNVLKTTMGARKRGLTEMPALFEDVGAETGPGFMATMFGNAQRTASKFKVFD